MQRPSRSTSQRVLSAIRAYYGENEIPPSHRDIAERAGIAVQRVQGYVEKLAAGGYLTYTPRVGRSIVLTDRLANYSTSDLIRTCAARGIGIIAPVADEGAQGVSDRGLPPACGIDNIP